MQTNIAVATASGKAYYQLVSELKRKRMPFITVKPGETLPLNIEVIITTKFEKSRVRFPTILIYDEKMDPSIIIEEALEVIRGKHRYTNLVVGVDPGKNFGIATVRDGAVLQTESTSSEEETALEVLMMMARYDSDLKTVRIGNGADIYRTGLIKRLEKMLPPRVNMESVEEKGTTKNINMISSRRMSIFSKDALSAVKISMRKGSKIVRENG
ncbi:MAG: hypothetical protein V1850_00485 [Candidatus Bathyarchaeota archaeon]